MSAVATHGSPRCGGVGGGASNPASEGRHLLLGQAGFEALLPGPERREALELRLDLSTVLVLP